MSLRSLFADLFELSKPSILFLNVLMSALGMWLAFGTIEFATPVPWLDLGLTLVGVSLVVGSANALNMVLELDVDAKMRRTQNRPLPAGRLSTGAAAGFGIVIGIVGTIITYVFAGALTALLGCLALAIYVLAYTPLKKRTSLALAIGAVPGAAPPLMGWVAVTKGIEWPGVVLFLILLVWQVPHFLAIALYSRADYERAGIKVVPVVYGDRVAKLQVVAYATLLIPLSLLLVPLGAAGWIYGGAALLVSLWFLVACVRGYGSIETIPWARSVFRASLVYLPALGLAVILDRVIL